MTAADHYKQLEGGTIEAVELIGVERLFYPVLLVRLPDGTRLQVEVLQDSEGNGPGHLGISPVLPQ